ncbi:MAG TPA: UPF0182 family protein [Nitrospiria bacterium]|jgi:hypothetical protein
MSEELILKKPMIPFPRKLIVFLILFLLILISGGDLLRLYVDWLWFQEIQYEEVFKTTLFTKIQVGLFFGIGFFLILFPNLYWAINRRQNQLWVFLETQFSVPLAPILRPHLNKIVFSVSVLISLLIGIRESTQWKSFLLATHSVPFGLTDSLFQNDFGYYVFQFPFLVHIQSWILSNLFLVTILTAIILTLNQGIQILPQGVSLLRDARVHLFTLGTLILFLKGWGYHLETYQLLFSQRGVVFGAVYADVNALLPVLKVLVWVSLLAGAILLTSAFREGWLLPLGAIGSVLIISIAGASIFPDLLHRLRVAPNEIVKETPYINQNISQTRFAYGLNKIEEKEFPAEENLTKNSLIRNDLTIKNIRLWDHGPLLDTYRQLQQIRPYYDFVDVDNDRYMINGEYRQVMLSPRELSYRNLPGGENWINEHLTYTHGFGATMGPVNRISPEGLPEFIIKDIPPSSDSNIMIKRPQIYYGEITNDYVFVKTKALEFDYPIGDKNQYSNYVGEGGVPISSLLRKLLFSIKFKTIKILLSNDITSESKIMFYRTIRERVNMIAPFFIYDQDPYLVISDEGNLYWIMDGYTTTAQIPYSQPALRNGENYIRNSVKVVIDAYQGTTSFYISDPEDPIVNSFSKIFPVLFKPMEEMPPDLKSHIRYPQDMFKLQANMFATYHMQDPQIFYNKEDLWFIPKKGEKDIDSYYTIMKLPKEDKEEFILMIPYTPARRDNMSAWLAARSDGPHYGKLIVYLFPKQKLIFGPRQIEARIDQDSYISQQLTLWSQRGSQVIRGSLLVIPIEESLLYIQPLYLAAEAGQLPELRRVIVGYGNQLTMEKNLEASLSNIFGGETTERIGSGPSDQPQTSPETDSTIKELIQLAVDHFQKAQTFQKEGNWAEYGEELNRLENVLRELTHHK